MAASQPLALILRLRAAGGALPGAFVPGAGPQLEDGAVPAASPGELRGHLRGSRGQAAASGGPGWREVKPP